MCSSGMGKSLNSRPSSHFGGRRCVSDSAEMQRLGVSFFCGEVVDGRRKILDFGNSMCDFITLAQKLVSRASGDAELPCTCCPSAWCIFNNL